MSSGQDIFNRTPQSHSGRSMAARRLSDRIIDIINHAAERFQSGELPVSGRVAWIICGLFVAMFLASTFKWWIA